VCGVYVCVCMCVCVTTLHDEPVAQEYILRSGWQCGIIEVCICIDIYGCVYMCMCVRVYVCVCKCV